MGGKYKKTIETIAHAGVPDRIPPNSFPDSGRSWRTFFLFFKISTALAAGAPPLFYRRLLLVFRD
jgi:hypothetical protein